MKFLKGLVVLLVIFTIVILGYGYLYDSGVLEIIMDYYNRNPSELINNKYTKSIDNDFVKLTNDFTAKNKQDLMNIYYTIISSGMYEFTFYCSSDYYDCEKDIYEINYDSSILAQANNFVNVYNSFKNLKTDYTTFGKVTIHVTRFYNNDDIIYLENKVNEIYNEIYNNSLTDEENIKNIHDYIINNTKYDKDSSNAVYLFKEGKANCNGYADAMALLLDKFNIPNVRISSETHIWNLAYVNNKWLHIDATWDDPVNELNIDLLYDTYLLKTTKEFEEDTNDSASKEHAFDKKIYYFAN